MLQPSAVAPTFLSCGTIKSLNIPSTVTSMGSSAFVCHVKNLYVSDLAHWLSFDLGNLSIEWSELYAGGERVTKLVIPESMTKIPSSAFDNWTGLEEVVIHDGVNSMGSRAFYGCTNLSKVSLGGGITAIQTQVFGHCDSLKELTLPSNVLVINSNAFYYNDWQYKNPLSSIRFMGDAPLMASDALTGLTATVYYSANNTTWTEEYFQNYGGDIKWLPDTEIPDIEDAPDGFIAVGVCGGNLSFEIDREGILRIYVTLSPAMYRMAARVVGDYAMDDYANPEDAPWYAYRDKIKGVVVESGVTAIGDNAFAACEAVTEVTIGDTVADIGSGAFNGCEALEEVTFLGAAPSFGEDCFGEQEVTIVYPENDETWTEETKESIGGNLSFVPSDESGHTHIYTKVITPPHCVEGGFTTYTCQCGHTYNDDFTDALGHDEVHHSVVEPSCTQPGQGEYYDCGRCGAILTGIVEIPAAGHKWNGGTVTKEPTQDAEGERSYSCTVCGETKTEKIDKLPEETPEDPKPVENPFKDIRVEDFFFEPVMWAVSNNVTSGLSATEFGPAKGCTRAQVVTFLWRAAGEPAPESSENPFTDVKEGQYYYDAVLWAVENGITTGLSADSFGPNANCNRGQIVTFLWRAMGKPAPTNSENPFTDVPDSQYYYDAVLWAVEKGITTGMSANSFAPNATCTRGQIVTFLYRAYK